MSKGNNMNENEINNYPSESNPLPSAPNEYKGPKDGFSFKWINLVLGVAFCIMWAEGSSDWSFYIYLAIVVLIHELGHVVMGKSFGCNIKEMQVFFLPFVSYKPKQVPGGSSWRDITWRLGALPLGGVTVFQSQGTDGNILNKPAWQRLLISAAGVLFNIATFLILYFVLPFFSEEWLWTITYLSLLLAVLNILPIYPLDGGAIVFALFEMITGKKPSKQFTKICAWIGFIFIILFFWIFPEWLNGILDVVFGAVF